VDLEKVIPFQQVSYRDGVYKQRRHRIGDARAQSGLGSNQDSGSFKVNPRSFRDVPFAFDKNNSIRAWQAFCVFNTDDPKFSTDPYCVHAEQLKATYEFYCAFNDFKSKKDFAYNVCKRSILEEGFNSKYSKLYKYSRQCYFGTTWEAPPEYPLPGFQNLNSWSDFRAFIQNSPISFTPEVILPPELLFPWRDELPNDIAFLEEESSCKLDKNRVRLIIRDLLSEPKKVPTELDFVLSQTNTKSCVGTDSPSVVEQKRGKGVTDKKYVGVTNWVDQGMPERPLLAVSTPVWKRPSEYRDAITLNPCLLYKVWKFNSYLKYMISHPGVGDYTDMTDLRRFATQHSFFIMTDWKKSGLTIPHWYIEILVEEINSKFPSAKIDFPSNGWGIYWTKEEKWVFPSNAGYGLGMVNNAYTLFNIVLFEYAKQDGVFTEKDKILSFNDDSVIGCEKMAYYRWRRICQDSGGYLDFHKTFGSNGPQFCEMHQFRNVKSNFKWVSAFHTAVSALWKSYNKDHYRFLLSDMMSQLKPGQDVSTLSASYNEAARTTMEHYILQFSMSYWSCTFNCEIPVELGGVNITCDFRTKYMLKEALCFLEQQNGTTFYKMANHLRVVKESFSNHPIYRPWKPMPKGPTRNYMLELGRVSGLNHELDSLSVKAHNQFLLDSEWYLENFWGPLSIKIEESRNPNRIDFSWIDWVKEQRWPTYAIPNYLVGATKPLINMDVLPFVRMEKAANKYSLPSMVEAFFQHYAKQNVFHSINKDAVSFKGYCLWEAPVVAESDHYEPIVDMELISKISDFSDPRRTFLDYYDRNRVVITQLLTKDFKSEAALELLKVTFKEDDFSSYSGATWYTEIPVPFKKEDLEILKNHLPDLHGGILMDIQEGNQVLNETAFLDYSFLDNDRRENKKFWKGKTSRQKKNLKKSYKIRSSDMGQLEQLVQDNPLYSVNPDDLRELLIAQGLKKYYAIPDPPLEEYIPQRLVFERPRLELPDWLLEEPSPVDEPEWDPEAGSEEIDPSELAAVLDALDRGDWDYEQEGD